MKQSNGDRQPSQARRPGRRARTEIEARGANFVEILGKASVPGPQRSQRRLKNRLAQAPGCLAATRNLV